MGLFLRFSEAVLTGASGRGICHDEKVYPAPETFNPDRFLDKDGRIDPSVKDPEVRVFGSGRRWDIYFWIHHMPSSTSII